MSNVLCAGTVSLVVCPLAEFAAASTALFLLFELPWLELGEPELLKSRDFLELLLPDEPNGKMG